MRIIWNVHNWSIIIIIIGSSLTERVEAQLNDDAHGWFISIHILHRLFIEHWLCAISTQRHVFLCHCFLRVKMRAKRSLLNEYLKHMTFISIVVNCVYHFITHVFNVLTATDCVKASPDKMFNAFNRINYTYVGHWYARSGTRCIAIATADHKTLEYENEWVHSRSPNNLLKIYWTMQLFSTHFTRHISERLFAFVMIERINCRWPLVFELFQAATWQLLLENSRWGAKKWTKYKWSESCSRRRHTLITRIRMGRRADNVISLYT